MENAYSPRKVAEEKIILEEALSAYPKSPLPILSMHMLNKHCKVILNFLFPSNK
jgi:hypothetical protein